jgi:hypothetical protein
METFKKKKKIKIKRWLTNTLQYSQKKKKPKNQKTKNKYTPIIGLRDFMET